MAVDTFQLLEPEGPLAPVFFPDTPAELDLRLQVYLDRAVAKVAAYPAVIADPDAPVRAWALHLAFKALHLLKSNSPNSASMDGLGGTSFAADQRAAFASMAQRYELEYLELLPVEQVQDVGTSNQSFSVRNVFHIW